jgi:CRP-like cAMP-binding protein
MAHSKQEQDEHSAHQVSEAAMQAMVSFISKIAPLDEQDITLFIPIVQGKLVKKHEFLLREGEVCRNVYFLTRGFFRMFYVDLDGNEINYRFTGINNFLVDFESFLVQKPSHFYWQAMEDATLLVLPHKEIHELYKSSPAWNNFGRLMAEHVYLQLNERVEMLLFMTPEERYNHLLNTNPELFNQVSQFQLSSYLGIKPESLSRLRKRLSKK